MSGMLQGLPQPNLPQEFSKHVLRQAEREMLIPRLRGKEPVARRKSPLKALSWLTAAAAVLVIGVLLVGRNRGGNQDQEKIVDVADSGTRPSAAPQPEVSKSAMTAPAALAAESTAGVTAEISDESKPTKDTAFYSTKPGSLVRGAASRRSPDSRETLPVPAVSEEGRAVGSVAKSAPSPLAHAKAPGRAMRVRLKDGQEIEPGTIVDLVPTSGDEALVIRVVVVDMRGGREAILQLFDSPDLNGKPLADAERSEWQTLDKKADVANAATGPQEGILFEVNTDKIASVIAKLDQEKVISELQVEAVELSQLEPQPSLVATMNAPEQDGDHKPAALKSTAIRSAAKPSKAKKSPGDDSESELADIKQPAAPAKLAEPKGEKDLLATKPSAGNSGAPALLSDTSNRLPGLDKNATPFDVSPNSQAGPNLGIGPGGSGKSGMAAPSASGPRMAARGRKVGQPVLSDLPKVVKVPRTLRSSKSVVQSQRELAAKRSKAKPAAADPLDPPASDVKGKELAKVTNGTSGQSRVAEGPGKAQSPSSSYVLFLLEQQQPIPIEPSSKKGR